MSAYDTLVHRWLHVPYMLNVRKFHSPKNPRATIVLIHGLGNSAGAWDDVANKLPRDVQVLGIDLLGFGESPHPGWVKYKIGIQARSVVHTLILSGLLRQRPIIVGHSMGSLVAITIARMFPGFAKQLLLCSPPLYKANAEEWLGREKLLRDFYKLVVRHPEQLELIAPLAKELGVVSKVFDVAGEQSAVYVGALEMSIINQTSLDDVRRLTLPIRILYGVFDPVVIGANLKQVDREKPNLSVKVLPVGHEIMGKYVQYIADELITGMQS